MALANRKSYIGKLFTLRRGVLPIKIVSMYCYRECRQYNIYIFAKCILGCTTTYHLNNRVTRSSHPDSRREYYGGVPEYIQAAKHIVFERDLCSLFEVQMAFSQ